MQGFTLAAITGAEQTKLTKSVEHEIYVKGTRSRCILEGHAKDNIYARFHTSSYH